MKCINIKALCTIGRRPRQKKMPEPTGSPVGAPKKEAVATVETDSVPKKSPARIVKQPQYYKFLSGS
jgi:hypothetical protein